MIVVEREFNALSGDILDFLQIIPGELESCVHYNAVLSNRYSMAGSAIWLIQSRARGAEPQG